MGTIPRRVVFGGKRLWRRLCRSVGPEHARLRAKWHAARHGRLYRRGDAGEGGNPNPRISLGGQGGFRLSVAISHRSEHSAYIRQGKRQERDPYSEAPRVTGRPWVPRKHESLIWDLVLSGRPYTVELPRSAEGRWRAYVGFAPEAPETVCGRGVVGIDLNPHGVAIAHLGRDGHPKPWSKEWAERMPPEAAASLQKYAGERQVGVAPGRIWLHAPEMWQAGADRRTYLLGVVAVDTALEAGKPLAREDLRFAKEHDTHRSFNRYSGNFPYSELAAAVDRRTRRLGMPIVPVDPASTSAEGRWRFAGDLGWSVHEAAALCIGRKALGHRRRFPRRLPQRRGAIRLALARDAGGGRTRRSGWPRRKQALRRKDEPGPSRPAASGTAPCWGKGACAGAGASGTGTWQRCAPRTLPGGASGAVSAMVPGQLW